jgi:uncharacterized repeat protein (TIGR03803 family)
MSHSRCRSLLTRFVPLFTVTISMLLVIAATCSVVAAQTFSVIHNFTGGADGNYPAATMLLDSDGRLYGSTEMGGIYNQVCVGGGCGIVFRMTSSGPDWILLPLYSFPGVLSNGIAPSAPLTFASDGSIYGTTNNGGSANCFEGCGTVFHLTPPLNPCRTTLCPWTETIIYSFQGGTDGYFPMYSAVVFDSAGNLYGTTSQGGALGLGTVYKLTKSAGTWNKTILHNFTNAGDGRSPMAGVILDAGGNLYGTTNEGGDLSCGFGIGCGTVFELSSLSGWTETTLYTFEANDIGNTPIAGLVFDHSGNLFGSAGGGSGGSGTVFELQPSAGSWTASVLQSFRGDGGPEASLTIDSAGNLYGTTSGSGAHYEGSVFELSPQNGAWIYTDLHDFHIDDGWGPVGGVTIDANGTLYGTTGEGGTGSCFDGCGVVWQITP